MSARLLPMVVLLCVASGPAFGGVLGDTNSPTRAERHAVRQLLTELTAAARRASTVRHTRPAADAARLYAAADRLIPAVTDATPTTPPTRVHVSRLNLPPPSHG